MGLDFILNQRQEKTRFRKEVPAPIRSLISNSSHEISSQSMAREGSRLKYLGKATFGELPSISHLSWVSFHFGALGISDGSFHCFVNGLWPKSLWPTTFGCPFMLFPGKLPIWYNDQKKKEYHEQLQMLVWTSNNFIMETLSTEHAAVCIYMLYIIIVDHNYKRQNEKHVVL